VGTAEDCLGQNVRRRWESYDENEMGEVGGIAARVISTRAKAQAIGARTPYCETGFPEGRFGCGAARGSDQ